MLIHILHDNCASDTVIKIDKEIDEASTADWLVARIL